MRMTEPAIWAEIRAAGPLAQTPGFDPLLVDDVIEAERAQSQFDRRRAFVASYAWAVPTPEAVELIASALAGRRVLEVCAGNGLWAMLLADAGLEVIATDGAIPGQVRHFEVRQVEALAAVQAYRCCEALMLCWPPFKDACAVRALRAFEGDRVLYVGDARFTADRDFHDELDAHWRLVDEVPLPSWPGTRDAARVFERKP
jgi:hypothetical protein